jgi:RNA polymerase sigma-70 factor (ECF subfamily)
MAGKQTTELGTREEARSATQRDEVVLVVRAAGEDAEAFEALNRCFYPRLRRFLERMTRRPQLVEEILNDTMLVVWRKAHTYNFRSKVSTWIFAIAFRKALKAVKRVDDPVAYEPEEGANPTRSGPEDELMAHQLHLLLSRAMTSLSAEQRAVIEDDLKRGRLPLPRSRKSWVSDRYREDPDVPRAAKAQVLLSGRRRICYEWRNSAFANPMHQAAEELLPWFVNGTLEGEELALVERHLGECVVASAS